MPTHPREPTQPSKQATADRPEHGEPGKTPGSAEGEDPVKSPRPDIGRTPGSAEGEPGTGAERTRR